jgi:hypothetical protein
MFTFVERMDALTMLLLMWFVVVVLLRPGKAKAAS